MRSALKGSVFLSACLVLVLTTAAVQAQDDKPANRAKNRGFIDDQIYTNLREVINHGANLYNTGDWNGCYRLWEGSLITIKPMLAHRPKMQEAITRGIDTARQDPLLYRRAWVLRSVLDQIRADIKGETEDGKDKPPVVTPEPPGKPKTLWARLGGEKGVTKIVDDFCATVVNDPKVDVTRGGKYKMEPAQVAKMKREMVEQISQATGGSLKYNGPDMKKVHKGMGITKAQFDAAGAHLKAAMEKNNVAPEDVKTVLGAINTYREEIVEPKKPEDKKPEDKKPEDKKPEDKKPTDKKPEDKKPIDTKPEDKKPTDKKPEDKKPTDTKPEDKKSVDANPADKKPAATASAEGKLTYKGKPLTGGIVTFVGADGTIVAAPIGVNGTYSAKGLKAGEYKVTIDTEANPQAPKPIILVPKKYSGLKSTPLTVKVKDGKQNQDFALND